MNKNMAGTLLGAVLMLYGTFAEPALAQASLSGEATVVGEPSGPPCPNCLVSATGTTILKWSCNVTSGCSLSDKVNPWPSGAKATAVYLADLRGSFRNLLTITTYTPQGFPITLFQSFADGSRTIHDASFPYALSGTEADGQWGVRHDFCPLNVCYNPDWASTEVTTDVAVVWRLDLPDPTPSPAPPTNLVATAGVCDVDLSWNTNGGGNVSETLVEVAYEGALSQYEQVKLNGAPGHAHFEGQRFCRPVRIRARTYTASGSGAFSGYSNIVDVQPIGTYVPALAIANDGEALRSSFNRLEGSPIRQMLVRSQSCELLAYNGQLATDGIVGYYHLGPHETTYLDVDAAPAVTYCYQVWAYRMFADGTGAWLGYSNVARGTAFGAWFVPVFLLQ